MKEVTNVLLLDSPKTQQPPEAGSPDFKGEDRGTIRGNSICQTKNSDDK